MKKNIFWKKWKVYEDKKSVYNYWWFRKRSGIIIRNYRNRAKDIIFEHSKKKLLELKTFYKFNYYWFLNNFDISKFNQYPLKIV
jgi:hypothetical protein